MRIFNPNPTILFLRKTNGNWSRYFTFTQNSRKLPHLEKTWHLMWYGFWYPWVIRNPWPVPVKTRTRVCGYGFWRVRARVAQKNPRVGRAIPYRSKCRWRRVGYCCPGGDRLVWNMFGSPGRFQIWLRNRAKINPELHPLCPREEYGKLLGLDGHSAYNIPEDKDDAHQWKPLPLVRRVHYGKI